MGYSQHEHRANILSQPFNKLYCKSSNLINMHERTSPIPRYRHTHQLVNSKQHPTQSRPGPGQIYLSSFKHLSQQNQQLIECIKELKNKNQQINLKIEEKLKLSRKHLQQEQLNYPRPTQYHSSENMLTLHNKYYRTAHAPAQQKKQHAIQSNEPDGSIELVKPVDPFEHRSKEKNNGAYRIIKQSHLKHIEELEQQGRDKTPPKTHKKMPLFDQHSATPQKNKLPSKYFVNSTEIQTPQMPKTKKDQNAVYLPTSTPSKQETIAQHNKKIGQLKAEVEPAKKTKDNRPYKTELKRSEVHSSIYYPKQQGEDSLGRDSDDYWQAKASKKYS